MSLKHWIALNIPTPKYMSMAHVGVDISRMAIHVVELERKAGHLILGKFGVEKFDQQINPAEPLISNEVFMTALKRAQKRFNLRFVEVSIPEERAYIFTTNLPEGSEEMIRNHIELHLEENVPISLTDAVFDYHVIERIVPNENILTKKEEVKPEKIERVEKNEKVVTAKQIDTINASNTSASTANTNTATEIPAENLSQQTQLQGKTFFASVSVVPKTFIDQYIEAFQAAGMTPVSFLIENQALSKSIIKQGDNKTKLMVHVGGKKTVLSIISEGSVQFTSTVEIGSEDFTQAIMKSFNVSRGEAIRMKTEKTHGSKKDDTTIFMSLINTASALKDEIDHIVTYWQSYIEKQGRTADRSISSVVLSGRDSLINGFKEYISTTVRLPAEIADVWSNIYDLNGKIPEIPYIDSLDYAVAIGLALPKI